MLEPVSRHGMMLETLFRVEDDLAANYNRVLAATIGKRTALTSFHLDNRGESPEIEAELGENYLQAGPSHRYGIIVSPDQKDADLMHAEFSFDERLLDEVYANFLSSISLATRVDGLYGEMDDSVREFSTLEDLLLINTIHLELHTPSQFLEKARELQGYVHELEAEPDLLIRDESALLKQMLALVKDVGDVRGYDLRPIQATHPVGNFYTRLFGGLSIFREVEQHKLRAAQTPASGDGVLFELSGATLTTLDDAPTKTVVIYRAKEFHPEDGPAVQFIPLQEPERAIRFLTEYGYADYAFDLLEARLTRLEEETLLSKGHDVVQMDRQQRQQAVYQYRDAMLPEWAELQAIKRNVTKGYAFRDIAQQVSAAAQSLLLTPAANVAKSTADVVQHTLTRFNDYCYETMLTHNRRHLERLYLRVEPNKQQYIIDVLSQS